jgi:hypothetical protein
MVERKSDRTTIQFSTQAANKMRKKKRFGESYEQYLRRIGAI